MASSELEMLRNLRKSHYINKSTKLMDFPSDILLNILLKLPVQPLCCIRCVSKTLKKMVDDPSFVTWHTRLLIATNASGEVPQFWRAARIMTKYPVAEIRWEPLKKSKHSVNCEIMFTPGAKDTMYYLSFVYYNLICFKAETDDDQVQCCLFNPLRGELLKLPRYDEAISTDVHDACGMGFDHIANTHKIVCVSQGADSLVARVLVLGTISWKKIRSVPPDGLDQINAVCAYGNMHWLTREFERSSEDMKIISFDFKKEEFNWFPPPPLPAYFSGHLNLITLRGSMAMVHTSEDMVIKIWVLKNYDTKDWALDYTINMPMAHSEFIRSSWEPPLCGEWEHGIFLEFDPLTFFLDLRRASTKHVKCRKMGYKTIFSYYRSLISLQDYVNLVEAEVKAGKYEKQPRFLKKLIRQMCFGRKQNKRWQLE